MGTLKKLTMVAAVAAVALSGGAMGCKRAVAKGAVRVVTSNKYEEPGQQKVSTM